MAQRVGSLLITLGLESGAFKSGLNQAERELRAASKRIAAVGETMKGVGQKMSLAVTLPLIAIGKASIDAAKESRDALGQVDAALKSMGNVAGKTTAQLQALAGSQMRQSLYDDDEILRSVTANLLTFGNISGDVFDRAQQAAIDLSARLGTDLQSSALTVGKALNDPIKGLSALSRIGIQFTEQQRNQIKTMVESGNILGAQNLLLGEFTRQVGGAAKAARDADPFAAMKQSMADFQEKIGDQLLKAMPAITGAITKLLEAFNSLSPGMQQIIVIGGVLAAAFGPLLMVFGAVVTATAPFTAAIGMLAGQGGILTALRGEVLGLSTAFGPWLIVIGAVAAAGYLIYQNWDKIGPVLSDLWQTIQTTIGPPFMQLVEQLKTSLTALWNGPLGQAVRMAGTLFMEFGGTLTKVLGPVLLAGFKVFAETVSVTFQGITVAVRAVTALFDGTFKTAIVNAVRQVYEGVKTWLLDRLAAVWESVKAKIDAVKGWFHGLYDAVVGHSYIPDMVDGIAAQMRRLDAVMVDKAKSATAKTKDAFRQLAEDVRPILDRLFPEALARNAYGSDFDKLRAFYDSGKSGLDFGQFTTATERLQNDYFGNRPANDNMPAAIAGWDQQSLVDMQGFNAELGRIGQTVSDSLPNLSSFSTLFGDMTVGFEGFRDDLARSFTDVILGAQSFGEAMRGVFNRLASRILDNLINNLLGNLLGGIIPGFASGTSFAPGGLALVGERGPELVQLPRGSKVNTANETARMMRGGPAINLTVHVNGAMSDRAARETGAQIGRAAVRTMSGPVRRAG